MRLLVPLVVLGLVISARDARAEIVVLKNGRTMSVKSCTLTDTTATIRLRQGGEVSFPASMIDRVDPDEVPYPDDQPLVTAAAEPVPAIDTTAMLPDAILAPRPFANLIATLAAAHKVDARLVHAVIEQESNYEPRARSKKGARGLMQLMPDTARQYGVRNSYDPQANLDAGIRHLKDLMSRLDLPTALAAYNAGPGAVDRAGQTVPRIAETQGYVTKIGELAAVGDADAPIGASPPSSSAASSASDRKSTRLNSSHVSESRMPSSA